MRKVKTTRFGELEIEDGRLLTFPEGVLGFAEARAFFIIEAVNSGPFHWLQSADVPPLAFPITNPRLFFQDYVVKVRPEDLISIRLSRVEEGVILVILTVPPNPLEMTANLLGPLLLNAQERLGKQLVLIDGKYRTKHRVFGENPQPAGGGPVRSGEGS
jgi:flagellar assembly factor FliW